MKYQTVQLKNYSKGRSAPVSCIVFHYTAGNTLESAINGLNANKASSHYIIDTDGTIIQTVNESDRAWHAGDSTWNGTSYVNSFSIGIEIVNFGYGAADESGLYRNYTLTSGTGTTMLMKETTNLEPVKPLDHRPETSTYSWAKFPYVQAASAFLLAYDIASRHSIGIESIIGHEHISPGRKLDPGPAFRDIWLGLYDYFELFGPIVGNDKTVNKAVQSHCARMGFKVGDIDGVWGKNTQNAVEQVWDTYAERYRFSKTKIVIDNNVTRDNLKGNAQSIAQLFKLIPGFDNKTR